MPAFTGPLSQRFHPPHLLPRPPPSSPRGFPRAPSPSLLPLSALRTQVARGMSLTPGSPPRTPRTPPYSPRSPFATPGSAPQTPTRTPVPRLPPSSPLRRPASQVSLRAASQNPSGGGQQSTSSASVMAARRVSGHGASALGLDVRPASAGPSTSSGGGAATPPPGTPQKTRARDLLRKHYGLGLGPPPPLGAGKSNQDPMDFGESFYV